MHLEEDVEEDVEGLTEFEFTTLVAATYSNKAVSFPDGERYRPLLTEVEHDLLNRDLLEWKAFRAKLNKNLRVLTGEVLTSTEKGKSILKKDLLKLILRLADMDIHTYSSAFLGLVSELSKEQLPILLTHNKSAVRSAALAKISGM